jgi:IS5 family transposase
VLSQTPIFCNFQWHVGSDRRCQPGCGAAPAQYGRLEEGNQAGPDTGELEGQAGSRRALDGQIQQGQTARAWFNAASRSSNPAIFGYRNHVSIDRRFGFIRRWAATDAATYEGRRLRQGLLDKSNTASGVWADTAYRSAANETFLIKNGFVSHIHRKKPKGRAMPETMRRANKSKSIEWGYSSELSGSTERGAAQPKPRRKTLIVKVIVIPDVESPGGESPWHVSVQAVRVNRLHSRQVIRISQGDAIQRF